MSSLLSTVATLVLCSLFAQPARAQDIIFFDDFEHAFAKWTATGFWNPEREADGCGALVAPFPSSNQCAWYGIGAQCNYDNGLINWGYLTTATPILVPPSGSRLNLRATMLLATEWCSSKYDDERIEFSKDGGATWVHLFDACYAGPTLHPTPWFTADFSLPNSYIGHQILLRFRFETYDELLNQTLGWFIDDVSLRVESGFFACRGTCPACSACTHCSGGCLNSLHLSAELAGSGFPKVSADTLVLTARDLTPTSLVVFVQGEAFSTSGTPFGDGRLCVSANVMRLAFKACPDGIVSYPQAGDAPIALKGLLPSSGGTRYYQVLYRDPGDYCTSAQLNATNGYRIEWVH